MSPQFVPATRVTCPHGALSLVTRVRPKARRVSHVPWRALACRHDVNHITQKARRVSHLPRRALACRHDVIHISPRLAVASPRDVWKMSTGPVPATPVTCSPGALPHDPRTCVTCPPGLSPGEVSTIPPVCFPRDMSHVTPQHCRMSPRRVSQHIHQEAIRINKEHQETTRSNKQH